MMPRPRPVLFGLALCLLVLAGALARSGDERDNPAGKGPFAGLDDYVNKALKEWEVPGLALAVVKDDAVVLAKGYGVRKLGDSAPVDEKTLFAIGSCSKAFTAAALALLVDEGKIKWDDPVTKHLPGFQLYDPYVTREITVRDLLCHRCGLERHDMLWYSGGLGRDEIVRRIRHAKPDWSFRSKFGYQNIMYLAAGQIIPAITGKSWDDFVKARIFTPLEMTASNTSVTALHGLDDVAAPHQKIDDKVQAIPYRNLDNIAPAGSINSNVTDMAEWVRLQLNEGKGPKDRLLSSGSIREMHTPQTVIRREGVAARLLPESHFSAYGLGWMLADYRGRLLISHGGGIDGMISLVSLVPEEKLGVVVLTNYSPNSLTTAVTNRIIDSFLGAKQKDWSAELLPVMKEVEKRRKETEAKEEKERVKDTKPPLPLEKYAGTYKDDLYGELKVAHEKDKLVIRYGTAFVGDAEHWHYNTFRVTWKDRVLDKNLVSFRLDAHGKVAEVRLALNPGEELVAKKATGGDAAPAITLTEEELRKFAGAYELKTPPLEVSVELVGGKLKLSVPGQPATTLVPVKPTRFRVEGVPVEASVEFEMADGKVKSLILQQGEAPKLTFLPKK
jgi:CubicO group peptidase (beta-lactamase class C family)